MAQNAVFYSSTMTLFPLPWLIPARGTFSLAVDKAMSYAEISEMVRVTLGALALL